MIERKTYVIELQEDMLGTVPKDKEVYKTYIESKKPVDKKDDEAVTVPNAEERGWTGFHSDGNGLFVYDYLIKGFIKASGKVLKGIVDIKNLRSKIDDFVFVFPRRIYLGKTIPDGVFERPLRGNTPMGERVTLVRSDFIKAGTLITFEVGLLKHNEISWEKVNRLMAHGELMGLGQFRNGSFGRFKVIDVK